MVAIADHTSSYRNKRCNLGILPTERGASGLRFGRDVEVTRSLAIIVLIRLDKPGTFRRESVLMIGKEVLYTHSRLPENHGPCATGWMKDGLGMSRLECPDK